MKYIFKINVNTDGYFSLQYVPGGMKFDDCEHYNFKKEYNDRDTAIADIINICEFLKGQIRTPRDYVEQDWNDCVDNFVKKLKTSKEGLYERVEEYISGNYDGTEFIFYVEKEYFKCGFYVTDEEYALIKNNHKVTNGMVKEVVMALFKENK